MNITWMCEVYNRYCDTDELPQIDEIIEEVQWGWGELDCLAEQLVAEYQIGERYDYK